MVDQMEVPPGYNPNASLLHGGTASIVPVQGGGSWSQPPPGYNDSVSLLSGGTGTIEPVRGGAVTFAEKPNVRVIPKNSVASNIGKAATYFTFEQYQPLATKVVAPTLESKKLRRERYDSNVVDYRVLYNVEEGKTTRDIGRPTYETCKALPPQFFQKLGKNVMIIDDSKPKIWLVTSIKGDVDQFLRVVDMITKDGVLADRNQYVIFNGQFFSKDKYDASSLLYDEVLKLKDKNPDRVFLLNELTESYVKHGCKIIESFYESKDSAKKKFLPVFRDPDIIVFPRQKIVFQNGDIPVSGKG